jgi:hypothetical protein
MCPFLMNVFPVVEIIEGEQKRASPIWKAMVHSGEKCRCSDANVRENVEKMAE